MNTNEMVQVIKTSYKKLIEHIEAHAILTPSEEYDSLINHLNENVEHFNKIVESRVSRKNGDAGEENNSEPGDIENTGT